MNRTGLLTVSIMLYVVACPWSDVNAEEATVYERLSALELRVKVLEKKLGNSGGAGSITLPVAVEKRQGWKDLRKGMTKPEVANLLGNPNKMEVHGDWELVRYSFSQGGSVIFDSHGFLSSWHVPGRELRDPVRKLSAPVRKPKTVPKAMPAQKKEPKSWSTVPQKDELLWDIPPHYEHLPMRRDKLTRKGKKTRRPNSWDDPSETWEESRDEP